MMRPVPGAIVLTAIMAVTAMVGVAAQPSEDTLMTGEGPLTVHPIHHATLVLQWRDTTIYVDPVGGAELFARFPGPDLILITHIHGDHLDVDTVRAVSTETTELVAPAAVASELGEAASDRLSVLANGETCDRHGVTIVAVPAYNLAPERQRFHPKGRDNGYVVTLGGRRLYISGDAEDIPEMRALANIDAAFVCMNLPYTMDVDRAADAVLAFAPRIVYPYHYRGQDGMSDLDRFRTLIGKDDSIEVRLLKWY